MSSLPPRIPSDSDDATKAAMFTKEGLPLDRACFDTAIATVDVGEGGPARRVECRPPQLLSAPSTLTSKTLAAPQLISAPSVLAFKTPPVDARISLSVGVNDSSLMDDDDDDELVDYFGKSGGGGAPLLTSPPPFPAGACDDIAPSRPCWNVHDHNVPALPSFYPLEQSAVFVPRASAPILAARIANVLQVRSIDASYDFQNAKVDCLSRSHVEFRIRMYRGRGEFDHGIIVEVQRRAGFDLSYGQDVSAILDAAEGKDVKDHSRGILPFCHDDSNVDQDMDSLDNSGAFSSLQVISSILCPPSDTAAGATVEGRELAIASLASMTNLERVGQTAVHLSHELLTSATFADLRRVVFSQVGRGRNQTSERLMLRSLEVLANVTNNCPQSPSRLAGLLSQNDRDVLSKLIDNIDNAAMNPHASSLSCVVLRNVCVSQVNVEDLIPPYSRGRLLEALINAAGYGGKRHAELQRHSQYCLELMV